MKIGILVGGGPAPGINGVIGASVIEAENNGIEILGIIDGFKHIAKGNDDSIIPLSINNVSRIHYTGGSILGISREKPYTEERMKNTIEVLKSKGITHLIVIGGDGTGLAAYKVYKASKETLNIIHVPKTIDNDLPIPGNMPTFGFETARHIGTNIVENLMFDSKVTKRWYFVVTQGREAGHLALGIAKSAGATTAIIPEEFGNKKVALTTIVKILEGAVIKRLAYKKPYGVAIIAEGVLEKIDVDNLKKIGNVEYDEYGHVRVNDFSLSHILAKKVKEHLSQIGINIKIISKQIGYELRSAPPIPFDMEYTRDLGFGAIKTILNGKSNALIYYDDDILYTIPFEELYKDSETIKTRRVNINSEYYEVAYNYMIRLKKEDIRNKEMLNRFSNITSISEEAFIKTYKEAFIYP